MRSIFSQLVMVLVACIVWQQPCLAQGWERTLGFAHADGLSDVLPTPDGGYITVGKSFSANNLECQVFLTKTDADGTTIWSSLFGDSSYQEFPKSIVSDGIGGYVIGGTATTDGIPYAFLARTDQFGTPLWILRSAQDSVQGRQVIRSFDGSYVLVGSLQKPAPAGSPDSDVLLMKVDENGILLWSKTYTSAGFQEGYALAELPSNELLLSCTTNDYGANSYDVLLIKTNAAGDAIWTKTLGTTVAEFCFAMTPTADGNYALTGHRESGSSSGKDAFLAKIDPDGNQIWWKNFALSGIESVRAVQQAADGGFVLTGDQQSSTDADRQVLLLKASANGNYQWQSSFGGVLGDGGNAIRVAPNAGYVLAGFTSSFGAGSSDGYLIRTDATGVSLSNFILGNVHSNLNNSCAPEIYGQNIQNYLVEIAGIKTYFGTTDADGNYLVPVEAGSYNVRLLNPSPIWLTCQDSVDVTLTGVFDTATVNFSIYSEVQCPAMEVDLSTLSLRRCFQNEYKVNYRNLGSQAAATAAVQIEFDPWLTVDSTSIPWIANTGNLYVFDVGEVPPFAEGSFKAWVTLNCDSTILGQTHCSEAHIFPDSLCFNPDPNWDGSSIELAATCTGDSVIFSVKNMGAGDMDDPLQLIVIEDVFVGYETQFQLEAFGIKTYSFPANGSTLRMEADQSPGHPGRSKPCISVEGCGVSPFPTGFVVDYPLNDADLFVDTDCRENIGSYDPNDKQGFPVGYGEQHFIEPGTDIEYLIRFQNTGTDTAFTVTIRDTLSQFLDPTSIEPGAASHPYRFEVYGTGILKFSFDEIMLPDSNTNEPLSHGFVKFRAKQRSSNTLGLVIENSAGIYFDFNAPVITNTVYHTLGINFIQLDPVNSVQPGTAAKPEIRVYPNPFDETALFELENVPHNELTFSLFDPNGRLVRQAFFDQNKYRFQREGLPAGLYYFRILSAGQVVSTGKVVLK